MILDEIIEKKKEKVKVLRTQVPLDEVAEKAIELVKEEENTFYKAMSKKGLSIIGEVKESSPSTGPLAVQLDVMERVNKYEASVDAISILTEEDYFLGSTEIFQEIRTVTTMPLLRKDFIIDPYQIYESKVIGADAILLIATALEVDELRFFHDLAKTLKLEVLLEVHDEEDLEKALKTDARIIGINNRNLKDFTISLETTQRLIPHIPSNRLVISESGIAQIKDIEYLKNSTINGILVGRTLMETEYPDQLAREWKEAYVS